MSVKTYDTHSELYEDMCCAQLITMGTEIDDEKFTGWINDIKVEHIFYKTKVIMFFEEGYDNEVIDSRIAECIDILGDLKVDVYKNLREDEIQDLYILSNKANDTFSKFVDEFNAKRDQKEESGEQD